MSENEANTEVAGKILKEEKKQSRKMGIQSFAMVIFAVCAVIITVAVLLTLNNMTRKINSIYTKADAAITTLNQVATDINEADLGSMAGEVRALTQNAADGVETTMQKIDSIDIESLNNSIERLDTATQAFEATATAIHSIFG